MFKKNHFIYSQQVLLRKENQSFLPFETALLCVVYYIMQNRLL